MLQTQERNATQVYSENTPQFPFKTQALKLSKFTEVFLTLQPTSSGGIV